MSGDFEQSMSVLYKLGGRKLDAQLTARMLRVVQIMMLGELYGLHTLHSILESVGVKKGKYYKLWQGVTYEAIQNLCLDWSASELQEQFGALLEKSASTWSRSNVSVVVDDSIFRQWLKYCPLGEYYDKYFSGQYGCVVHGFRLQLLGVAIGDSFYPLYFECVAKGKSSKEVALKLVQQTNKLLLELSAEKGVDCPKLHLSVDSGFTDADLIAYCEREQIGFIGVPKKNQVFYFQNKRMKLSEYIKKVFLKKEAEYEGEAPFTIRVRAYCQSLDREMTLLFFRLNDSKKVSIIFCNELNIMAKTLRRRFFQRTKIELFFRFLKDTLKIQKSTSTDYASFIKKLSVAILKASICLKMERFFRKKQAFKRWSFVKIRQHVIYADGSFDDLMRLITTPFATNILS